MASGMKQMVINTQERAISTDINRLQAFAGTGVAEFLRYLNNVTSNDDLEAGAVGTEYASLGTPLRAEIANGLLVRPQNGSLDFYVDPGVMYAIAPDGDADSSNYKFVQSSGVSTPGALTMTANASGSTRIDVIECSVTDTVLETDNRDIFNAATGLFTATSVTKASGKTLTFRVRAGTPAAGYPAAVSGWLPLAVASVPNGTTATDTVTFWDVRPMLNDRVPNSTAQKELIANLSGLGYVVGGHVEVAHNGRRLGGKLRRGSPGTDAETIDFSDAANRDGFVDTTAEKFFYLLTPFGLPRWARYTGSGTRVPRSPRGIPVASLTHPNVDGTPSAAITLPTSTGLGGTTSSGRMFTMNYNLITSWGSTRSFRSDGNHVTIAAPNYRVLSPQGGASVASVQFYLIPGTNIPMNAKRVRVVLNAVYNINQSGTHDIGNLVSYYVLGDSSAAQANVVNQPQFSPGLGANPYQITYTSTGTHTTFLTLDLMILGGAPEYASRPTNVVDLASALNRVGGGTQPTFSSAELRITDYWF